MSTQKPQDFERLSAYLDNELSAADQAALEARLAKEPELAASLNDLRRTVQALRNLPAVKPPRSFTLTPEQAGLRVRRGPLFSTFRLAAALCTLLLALAVGRDLVTSGSLAASAPNDATGQGAAATALLVPNVAPLPTATPQTKVPSHTSAVEPTVQAGASGTAQGTFAATPALRMSLAGPSGTPTAGGRPPETTPGLVLGAGAPSETPGAVAMANAAPTDTPANTAVTSAGAQQPATAEAAASTAAPAPATQGLSGLRLAEIALAVLALALAAATWLTRRA